MSTDPEPIKHNPSEDPTPSAPVYEAYQTPSYAPATYPPAGYTYTTSATGHLYPAPTASPVASVPVAPVTSPGYASYQNGIPPPYAPTGGPDVPVNGPVIYVPVQNAGGNAPYDVHVDGTQVNVVARVVGHRYCNCCQAYVPVEKFSEPSETACFLCILLFICGFFICAFIPLCIDSFREKGYRCCVCKTVLEKLH